MVWMWAGFLVLVLALLALDLGVLNRGAHTVSAKRALGFVAFFVALGAIFNFAVYFIYAHDWMGMGTEFAKLMMGAGEPGSVLPEPHRIGMTAAGQFLAGWLTEYSLSVDNLFVIALIFTYFKVPAKYQHRVLFWGILGALIARGVMIFAGTALVQRFEWLIYILGAFLIYTGIKLAFSSENDDKDFDSMLVVRLARRAVPISSNFDGQRFFTHVRTANESGAKPVLHATPLFLVLLIVETTDVIFAVDSIPAIIGITRDPFLVFTSNVFAILGLRSLFFALAALMDKFHYLKYSLALVLAFVGVKMMLEGVHHIRPLLEKFGGGVPNWLSWLPRDSVHISTTVSLGVIAGSLALGVIASLLYAKRHPHETA